MKKRSQAVISFLLCFALIALPIAAPRVMAGIPSDIVGVENETGGAVLDNFVGISSGEGGDKLVSISENGIKANPGSSWYTKIGTAGKFIKWGGTAIGAIDTVRDSYTLVTGTSKHSTAAGRWADKGLQIVGVAMGWATIAGTVVAVTATAPVTGTAATVTGLTFAAVSAGVAITKGIVNSDTVKGLEDLAAGKKKLVFIPFENSGLKDGLDILDEMGMNPYDHSGNEIPDPNTGIPVYKPNIYLYNDKDMTATVNIYPPAYITKSEPLYNEQTGWNTTIVNGSLNGCNDYLFYEANVPDEDFQKEKGWIIDSGRHVEGLVKILGEYGFNDTEKKDFLKFWEGMLESGKEYAVYPQNKHIVDSIMPLIISPKPDNTFRVWFYFVPVTGDMPEMEPADSEKINRTGFSAIEWGGMIGR